RPRDDSLRSSFSCGDPLLADQVHAPDCTDHNASNPHLTGREKVKRSVRDWCAAFPNTRTIVDDLVAESDRVAARWTSAATRRGEFMSIPASGAEVVVTGSGLFRLVQGRIVESWDHFDALGLPRQLGARVSAREVQCGSSVVLSYWPSVPVHNA